VTRKSLSTPFGEGVTFPFEWHYDLMTSCVIYTSSMTASVHTTGALFSCMSWEQY